MTRELKVHMDFYLTMNKSETEEQAIDRFIELMSKLEHISNQESAYQVYDFKEQEI